ncbi:MAG: 3'-5' exonuclease [Candidatus Eremiobacteraeota bacterium]|nr:3'-5' exonuclease [Candidatus Eremiobacteraeota bacterium]
MLERYCVIDVETTGFSPVADRIVEIACALIDGDRIVERWSTLVNPGIPIPSRATAIHGITDQMVAAAPELRFALRRAAGLCEARLVAAHCAHFDLSFVGPSVGTQALCTMRLARAVFPEAPNHKNQTLRYYLGIDEIAGEDFEAHRALSDAVVSAYVLIACRRRFHACNPGVSWGPFLRRHALVCRKAA